MRYYKIVSDGYLTAIGTGPGGTELTEAQYNEILAIIRSHPQEEGKGYHLREDLTWEEYDLPEETEPEDEEISDEEALNILLGGAT